MRWLLPLMVAILLLCCVQEERPETPLPTTPTISQTTPEKTPTTPKYEDRKLVETTPVREPEKIPKEYLLQLKPWKLIKGTEKSDYYTIEIPRRPAVEKVFNVSANLKKEISTPLIEDLIYIFDNYTVYAYKEELVWSLNIYERFEKEIRSYGLGDHLYIGTTSSKKGFSLIAIDKENGKIVWHREINIAGGVSALIVGDLICVGTDYLDPRVMCFTRDGEMKWNTMLSGTINGFAMGNGKLFVSANKLYAFDLQSGKRLWEVDKDYSAPLFKSGMVFVSKQGYIYAFSEDGKELWKKYFGSGEDSNYNPFLSASNYELFIPRILVDKPLEPLELQVSDFKGNLIGVFKLSSNEIPGAPVVSDQVVVLPVKTDTYGKIYILWRGLEKLFELKQEGKEVLMPKVAVSKGKIYVIFSDKSSQKLYILGDSKKPEIVEINIKTEGRELNISAIVKDPESAIYRVSLAIFSNGKWSYKDMDLGRRYVREPIGGYGLSEELFFTRIRVEETVEFYVIAIDNSNNYAYSKVYAYKLT